MISIRNNTRLSPNSVHRCGSHWSQIPICYAICWCSWTWSNRPVCWHCPFRWWYSCGEHWQCRGHRKHFGWRWLRTHKSLCWLSVSHSSTYGSIRTTTRSRTRDQWQRLASSASNENPIMQHTIYTFCLSYFSIGKCHRAISAISVIGIPNTFFQFSFQICPETNGHLEDWIRWWPNNPRRQFAR